MNCPYCENMLTDASPFCPFCGGDLREQIEVSCELSLKDIVAIVCKKYKCGDLYISPNIPRKKLNNLHENTYPPSDIEIFALIDSTVFGSSKYGMLITSSGLYLNNDTQSDTPGRFFIEWKALLSTCDSIYPLKIGIGEVALTPSINFEFAGCEMNMNQICGLVQELRSSVKKLEIKNTNRKMLSQMHRCSYCDAILQNNSISCPSCGAFLKVSSKD